MIELFFIHLYICTSTRLLLTSMFSKFGVGQDLFAELEPVSVLFVFVTSLSKKGKIGQENKGKITEKEKRREKLILEFKAWFQLM